jgi:hypothetical protein
MAEQCGSAGRRTPYDREVAGDLFTIRTKTPRVKVSWEVKAVRNDPWVRKRAMPVEVEKRGVEKGKYQHPELYGEPPENPDARLGSYEILSPLDVDGMGEVYCLHRLSWASIAAYAGRHCLRSWAKKSVDRHTGMRFSGWTTDTSQMLCPPVFA